MNDHDHRHPYDGLDDDAIFADIIAHLNDEDAAEPEQATMPAAHDAPVEGKTDDRTVDHTGPLDHTGPETTHEATDEAEPQATDPEHDEQPPENLGGWLYGQPPVPPSPSGPQAAPAPEVWRAPGADGEDEEHFEPLPVSPLPVGDLQFWAILAGMVGGPLMLVYLVFFNRDASSYWTLTAIAMSVGGFGLLVSRLPGQHEDDDDGARL